MKSYVILILLSIICLTIALWIPSSLLHSSAQMIVPGDSLWIDVRLIRVLHAFFAGGAVALSSLLCQIIFKNPIASPSVLGTESGGALGALVWMLCAPHVATFQEILVASLLSALLVSLLNVWILRRSRETHQILVIGFAINSVFAAGALYCLIRLVELGLGPRAYGWLLGQFGTIGPLSTVIFCVIILVIWFAGFVFAKWISVLSFGDDVAVSILGPRYVLKFIALLLVSILVASSLGLGGVLPLVGLIIPHLGHRLGFLSFSKNWFGCFLLGGSAVVVADTITRVTHYPQEAPVALWATTISAVYLVFFARSLRFDQGNSRG
jgi:ABC-type Fe3+-siderophore transport system permease subunit